MNCPEWAKYVVERDKEYEQRAKINEQNYMFFSLIAERTAKKLKRTIENRTTGFSD